MQTLLHSEKHPLFLSSITFCKLAHLSLHVSPNSIRIHLTKKCQQYGSLTKAFFKVYANSIPWFSLVHMLFTILKSTNRLVRHDFPSHKPYCLPKSRVLLWLWIYYLAIKDGSDITTFCFIRKFSHNH